MIHNELLINAVKYCNYCKHRRLEPAITCAAFPDGISYEILVGEIDHTQPIEGDNGIQFEPLEEYAESKPWLDTWWKKYYQKRPT